MFNSNPYKTIDIIILFSPFFNIKDVKNYFISQKSYDNVSFSMVRYSVILKWNSDTHGKKWSFVISIISFGFYINMKSLSL